MASALESLPAGIDGRVCSVMDYDGMAALLGPGVDILVNNAGVIGSINLFADAALEDCERNIAINLLGPVPLSPRCAARHAGARGRNRRQRLLGRRSPYA